MSIFDTSLSDSTPQADPPGRLKPPSPSPTGSSSRSSSSVPASIRSLLLPTVATILAVDYPLHWPELLPNTLALISTRSLPNALALISTRSLPNTLALNSTRSLPAIEAGLLTLVELIRLYRWPGRDQGDLPDQLIHAIFPLLLSLAHILLAQSAKDFSLQPTPPSVADANSTIGSLMHLILKIYKMSITANLPLLQQQNFVPWGQLLLTVVQKLLKDTPGFPSVLQDHERWGWSKAKKWAYFTLDRLCSRYSSPSQLPNSMLHYKPFAENFVVLLVQS